MDNLIKKYVKKNIEIEAVLYDGTENAIKAIRFMNEENKRKIEYNNNNLIIPTLEGDMIASIGDYIIKGISGELYPCKPDIFKKSYDPSL